MLFCWFSRKTARLRQRRLSTSHTLRDDLCEKRGCLRKTRVSKVVFEHCIACARRSRLARRQGEQCMWLPLERDCKQVTEKTLTHSPLKRMSIRKPGIRLRLRKKQSTDSAPALRESSLPRRTSASAVLSTNCRSRFPLQQQRHDGCYWLERLSLRNKWRVFRLEELALWLRRNLRCFCEQRLCAFPSTVSRALNNSVFAEWMIHEAAYHWIWGAQNLSTADLQNFGLTVVASLSRTNCILLTVNFAARRWCGSSRAAKYHSGRKRQPDCW